MKCITILLIILTVFIICSLFSLDHFKPIKLDETVTVGRETAW